MTTSLSIVLLIALAAPEPAQDEGATCSAPVLIGVALGATTVAVAGAATTLALGEVAQSRGESFAGSTAPRLGAFFLAPVVAVLGGALGGAAGGLIGYGACSAHAE